MTNRLLVVGDEPRAGRALCGALSLEGYDVALATDGHEALRLVELAAPDAVVVDVLRPELQGVALCRRLRQAGERVPVLLLGPHGTVGDRIAGLEAGADDYLAKPFVLVELLARVRALLRRSAPPDDEAPAFGDLALDPKTREARRGQRAIGLTPIEFRLLDLFLRNPRQVLDRSYIFTHVWGFDFGGSSNSLTVYIGRLRRKTEAGGEPRLIHTSHGIGYVLRE